MVHGRSVLGLLSVVLLVHDSVSSSGPDGAPLSGPEAREWIAHHYRDAITVGSPPTPAQIWGKLRKQSADEEDTTGSFDEEFVPGRLLASPKIVVDDWGGSTHHLHHHSSSKEDLVQGNQHRSLEAERIISGDGRNVSRRGGAEDEERRRLGARDEDRRVRRLLQRRLKKIPRDSAELELQQSVRFLQGSPAIVTHEFCQGLLELGYDVVRIHFHLSTVWERNSFSLTRCPLYLGTRGGCELCCHFIAS